MNEQPEGVEPLEPPGDQAFRRSAPDQLHHMQPEMTWGGALSFLRRAYTRDPDALAAADIVITGIPFDMATSNRPGARLGPRATARRRRSAWSPGSSSRPREACASWATRPAA